jgi:hypothetical protein
MDMENSNRPTVTTTRPEMFGDEFVPTGTVVTVVAVTPWRKGRSTFVTVEHNGATGQVPVSAFSREDAHTVSQFRG